MTNKSLTAFIDSLRHVFDVAFLMNVETAVGTRPEGAPVRVDASASVDLSGDLNATLVLGFPMETADRIVSLFTGLEVHEQTDDDVVDVLGEIANMVAGNAKPHLYLHDVRSAPPDVRFQAATAPVGNAQGPTVWCVSDCGQFTLRLILPTPRPTITTRVLREAVSR